MTKTQATIATPNAAIAPVLLSQIHEAPGRGILPNISPHSAVAPQLYGLDAQPIEQISELLQRQYLSGNNVTFVKGTAKKGAFVPLHHHINEQITWITEGAAEVYSQGRKYIMKAGDIMIIPSNIPHEFIFPEDTIDIDIFFRFSCGELVTSYPTEASNGTVGTALHTVATGYIRCKM